MKKYVCLRDDDTNFYTTIEELKNGYGEIWGKYPISLATIPFAHGSERKIMEYDTCPDKFARLDNWEQTASVLELSEYHRVHPIGDNSELVNCLKELIKDDKIEIMQHGVYHRYNYDGAEMRHENIALNTIEAGKRYLEKVFDVEINVIVPPSNTIDNIVVKKLRSLGYDLLCSGPIRFEGTYSRIINYFRFPGDLIDGILTKLVGGRPLRKRQGIYISDSYTFDKNKDDEYVYRYVKNKIDKFGYYSITTHYRLLSDLSYRERYIDLIKRIAEDEDVVFVTASKYFKIIKDRTR